MLHEPHFPMLAEIEISRLHLASPLDDVALLAAYSGVLFDPITLER